MLLLCNTGKREQRLKEGVWGEDKGMTERERKIREEENVYLHCLLPYAALFRQIIQVLTYIPFSPSLPECYNLGNQMINLGGSV